MAILIVTAGLHDHCNDQTEFETATTVTYYVSSSVSTEEMVVSSVENILNISTVLLCAIAVPVGFLVMCLGLTALILCAYYICNQQREQCLLTHKNAHSHEQEPVYFTIEPTDHQQVTDFELSPAEAGAYYTTIEGTYEVITGGMYENMDTAKTDNVNTPPSSEVNIISLPYNSAVTDKETNLKDNEVEFNPEICNDANYGQEDAYGFPTELANYVPNK